MIAVHILIGINDINLMIAMHIQIGINDINRFVFGEFSHSEFLNASVNMHIA